MKAALDPTAIHGPALWAQLAPVRRAAACSVVFHEIGSTLQRLGWEISKS